MMLLTAIVSSRVMSGLLAGGNQMLELLPHALASGAALMVLVMALEPISGAYFNPAVTVAQAHHGKIPWREVPAYVVVQLAAAVVGVWIAQAMFGIPGLHPGTHVRTGAAQLLSEFVATSGLLMMVFGTGRLRPSSTPFAVGFFIMTAALFTGSTAFANPAVTIARAFTDTPVGIRPLDTLGFVAVQFVAALLMAYLFKWLVPDVPVEHHSDRDGIEHPEAGHEKTPA